MLDKNLLQFLFDCVEILSHPGHGYRATQFQQDLFDVLDNVSPLLKKTSSVMTDWLEVSVFSPVWSH